MKSKFPILLISLLVCAMIGWCQSGSAVDQQKLRDAATQGFGLNTGPSVPVSVSVDAILLPARVCARLFGKEIANNYAAVELTVGNKNQEAAFLVHSVLLDYSNWLFADQSDKPPADAPFQTATQPNQVASVEYRVARGEAQDAQMWSSRNWTMRALVLLGVLGTGAEFAFKEPGITKGIGAFTGQFVPAAATFWPDGAGPQLDRISDFGFRTNKVIPKASSDILVAFFPIDRFITPGLKKIYLKSPSVFFLPGVGALDPKAGRDFRDILRKLNGGVEITDAELKAVFSGDPKDPKVMQMRNLFDNISMNRIRVVVKGTMAVDVDTIPARIDSVAFDGTNPDFTKAGTLTGEIKGSLLTNGQPTITDIKPPVPGLTLSPKAVTDGSTDAELHFSLAVPSAIPACTELTFQVTKTKDDKTVTSNKKVYQTPAAAGITCPPVDQK